MATIHFMGYVEPRELLLRIENLTPIYEQDKATDIVTSFTIAIWDSVVSVECEAVEIKPEYISNLWTRSLELSRTVVNLIGLKHGWGVWVHLDTFIGSDGLEERLINQGDVLKDLIDAYNLEEIDILFNRVASDVDLFMAIQAMMGAISTPRMVAIDCARALDGIRQSLAPGKRPEQGWTILQESLNADAEYLKLITSASKNSRHGKHDFLPVEDAEQVLQRTWIVFNRYLHYLKSANTPLPLDVFPQLKNSSALQS